MKEQDETKIKAKAALANMVEDGLDKAVESNQISTNVYDKQSVYMKNKEREARIEKLRAKIVDDYNNNKLDG